MKHERSRTQTYSRQWARGLGAMSLGILLGFTVFDNVRAYTEVEAYSIEEPRVLTKAEKAGAATAVSAFGAASSSSASSFGPGTQTVLLDFDTGTDDVIVYTATMRDAIEAAMETHYADFDVTFTQIAPPMGDFSTIIFNSGSPGGLAEHIDFRNVDPNDTAVVNIGGLGLAATADIVSASAIIGSHEMGHLLGLRHGDSYGPIGSGISSTGVPGSSGYLPAYPGPSDADETTDHIMASPASVGSSLSDTTTPSWFSERSAVKLEFNESGSAVSEDGLHGTPETAQALTLMPITVPNTIVSGDNAGAGPFGVDALAVTDAALSAVGELDYYSFIGSAGDLFNFEVISEAIADRISDVLDTFIRIFMPDKTTPVPYYTGTAENDDEFETFDSTIIDLFLPEDGTYFIEVSASPFVPSDVGDYELFLYRFPTALVPEPGTVVLLALGLLGIGAGGHFRRCAALPKD